MKLTEKQIKKIIREVEYEWTDEAEKELQERLIHWANSYNEEGVNMKSKTIEIPNKVSHYFWRDLFTSVVHTIHGRVENKLRGLKC